MTLDHAIKVRILASQPVIENIPLAKVSDYRPATQRVFRSAAHPSHIVLPERTR